MHPAVTGLVLLMVVLAVGLFGLWVAALLDVVRARDMDDTSRLIVALLLIFMAPIGMIVWAVVRGSVWRTGLLVTLGLGIGLTTAVVVALAIDRAPRHTVTVTSSASGSMPIPAHPPVGAP